MIERGPVPAGDLPLFPFTNAAQLFHAQAQYLASDEVQGLRFISQHAQDTRPVNSVATSLRVDSDTAQIGERAASSFLPAVAPPVGLVYGSSDGLWRLGTDGESQLLTERIDALPSPDAAHAVYIDDGHRLWLMDLADGSERQLAAGIDLSWLYNWGDDHTMRLNNPAWSPNGSQVAWLWAAETGTHLVLFDLVRQKATTVLTWRPAQFGTLPPSPAWNPDGEWLVIEVLANNEAETGL